MNNIIICCGVLKDEIEASLKKTNSKANIVTVPEHLHLEPENLKIEIQRLIDKADEYPSIQEADEGIDYIVLAFGLCGGALNGLKTKKHAIIVPKAHDCISFFLGSSEKYKELFNHYGGKSYWFTLSFLKQGFLPIKTFLDKKKNEYLEKFDEDEADFLIDMEKSALYNYTVCAIVDDENNPSIELREAAMSCVAEYGWETIHHNATDEMFIKIASGDYNEKEFLIVPPFKTIKQSDNEEIITYEQSH